MNNLNDFKIKRFTCLECGECCTAWNLPVEEKLYEKIIELNWVKELLKKQQQDFKITPTNIYLPKKEKICVFLASNKNLCLLQQNNGIDYKPLECQRFPFAFARDKNGEIYFDTSFFCKAIIKNEGEIISESLKKECLNNFDFFEFPEHIFLSFDKMVTIDEFQDIRKQINKYLFEHCISTNIENWPEFFLNTHNYIEKFSPKSDIESQKIKKSNYKNKLLTSIFLRKNNIAPDFFKILLGIGRLKEPIIAEPINLSQLNDIKVPDEQEIKELLLRYLLDITQRNILHAHKHTFAGIILISLFAYHFTLWYSRALARVQSKNEVELFHLELAIRIMERYYIGHNVRFLENFRSKPKQYLIKLLVL